MKENPMNQVNQIEQTNHSSDTTGSGQQAYPVLLRELLPVLNALCELEEGLVLSASKDDTEQLNRLVTEAQPLLLRFRGLDRKRLALLQELSLPKDSLVIPGELLPEALRAETQALSEELSGLLLRFRSAREAADRIMQLRLAEINEKLQGLPEPKSFQDRRV